MSTGLAASTVTPGRIAPDPSVTTPEMALCALARVLESGVRTTTSRSCTIARLETMVLSLSEATATPERAGGVDVTATPGVRQQGTTEDCTIVAAAADQGRVPPGPRCAKVRAIGG